MGPFKCNHNIECQFNTTVHDRLIFASMCHCCDIVFVQSLVYVRALVVSAFTETVGSICILFPLFIIKILTQLEERIVTNNHGQ